MRVKLIKRINTSSKEIIEKTKKVYEYPPVSPCCNQFLFINDFVPVLVVDEKGKKYETLFCKECSLKINEWFDVIKESLAEE